ncbi:MAG: hypothetical protein COC06_08065 [Bacteroidales bacterium]|nr:MAG: hypothetical protein COC06_08065 [Bacteroidales bacterium]
MIYLIWSGINMVILLYFFYLIIGFISKGKKIFKPQFKIASIALMVIGIVQIISATELDDNTNRISFVDNHEKMQGTGISQMILENNLTFDIQMSVTYRVGENEFIPIESYSNLNRFVIGFEWDCKSAAINEKNLNGEIKYDISGVLKWNLFGINIYSQPKAFEGIIE